MQRTEQFAFRVNTYEKHLISTLAKRLQRSRSDAVRFVVINAAKELELHDGKKSGVNGGGIRHAG